VVRLHRAAACAVAVIRTFGCAAALEPGGNSKQLPSSTTRFCPATAPRSKRPAARRNKPAYYPTRRFDTNNLSVHGRNT